MEFETYLDAIKKYEENKLTLEDHFNNFDENQKEELLQAITENENITSLDLNKVDLTNEETLEVFNSFLKEEDAIKSSIRIDIENRIMFNKIYQEIKHSKLTVFDAEEIYYSRIEIDKRNEKNVFESIKFLIETALRNTKIEKLILPDESSLTEDQINELREILRVKHPKAIITNTSQEIVKHKEPPARLIRRKKARRF